MEIYDLEVDESAAVLLVNWVQCQHCSAASRPKSLESPWECPRCQSLNDIPVAHFPFTTIGLVDLIQQQRWLQLPAGATSPRWTPSSAETVTVLLFCALQETLLRHLLRSLLAARGASRVEQDQRLRRANGFTRRTELFEELTNESMASAIEGLGADATAVWEFVGKVVAARNEFLHAGMSWAPAFSRTCVNALPVLMRLY